jgi:hypothetical protein
LIKYSGRDLKKKKTQCLENLNLSFISASIQDFWGNCSSKHKGTKAVTGAKRQRFLSSVFKLLAQMRLIHCTDLVREGGELCLSGWLTFQSLSVVLQWDARNRGDQSREAKKSYLPSGGIESLSAGMIDRQALFEAADTRRTSRI